MLTVPIERQCRQCRQCRQHRQPSDSADMYSCTTDLAVKDARHYVIDHVIRQQCRQTARQCPTVPDSARQCPTDHSSHSKSVHLRHSAE
eukprot:3783976-Prymnesium_polylepis.1